MATGMIATKRQVLGLYAQCLRSARRCPAWEQREMMKAYVKMKFRHDAGVRDPARIRSLLADASDELERMDYYHAVYQAKLREQEAAREANTMRHVASAAAPKIQIAICPHCSTAFQPPSAKFCSNCGEKRVDGA
ncbi:Complex 1 lyr protein [Globisporangium polare]